jgi:hypothetical protein
MGERTGLGMSHFDKEISGAQLRLLRELGHRKHRRETNPSLLTGTPEVLNFPLFNPFFQIRLEDVPVLSPDKRVFKNLPTGPLRITHQFHQPLPLVLFDIYEKDKPILALINAPGIDKAAAQARGHLAHVRVVDEILLKK